MSAEAPLRHIVNAYSSLEMSAGLRRKDRVVEGVYVAMDQLAEAMIPPLIHLMRNVVIIPSEGDGLKPHPQALDAFYSQNPDMKGVVAIFDRILNSSPFQPKAPQTVSTLEDLQKRGFIHKKTTEIDIKNEDELRRVLRVFKGEADKYRFAIDGGGGGTTTEIRARILWALSGGPIDRIEYLERVTGKTYSDISLEDRKKITLAQGTSFFSNKGVRFPLAHASKDPHDIWYNLPQDMKIVCDRDLFS